MEKITDGNDPVVQTVYRQTGSKSYRPATEKEIKEGLYLVHKEGLTKREYFAGLAMQGMLANRELVDILQRHEPDTNKQGQFLAMAAVEQADCLISELNKPVDTKP